MAYRPAVLILAVMASCAGNGLAPTDAATSTGDAIRPDIATDPDAAADAPAATTDGGPGDGADAGALAVRAAVRSNPAPRLARRDGLHG